jgi:hypothetical protein
MDDIKWVDETRELTSRLNSQLNQEMMDRYFSVYLMEENPDEKARLRKDIESILGVYAPLLMFSKKPVLKAPPVSSGILSLGNVMQGEKALYPYLIEPETINKHIAIFGATGSGKTSLVVSMLRQLTAAKISWLAFDFKRDLRGLVKEGAWVLRWEDLRINPLASPHGVSPKIWMTILPDIFAHCFYWFAPSENYMLEFLSLLYGKLEGNTPTIRELYDFIVKREERNRKRAEYFAVVTNRLASMLTVLKDVIDVRQGMPLEELFAHPVVIEVDQLRRDEANFLVEYLLAYLFYYRMLSGQRSKLAHVIVCDEANRWFYPQRRWKDTTVELGLPFIDSVPQIIRDYCEGMIFASQGCLSQTVMANTNLKIVGFLGDGEDIEALSKSLCLTEVEQAALSRLETGNWLVSKAGESPFIVHSPRTAIDKTVTDAELKERMQPIISRLMQSVEKPTDDAKLQETMPKIPDLSEDAWSMILDVNTHPFKGFIARCKAFNLSGRKAEAVKAELAAKGLVIEISTNLGKSNRQIKFLMPTELGLAFLRKHGYDTTLWKRTGNQNFEHQLYSVLIAYAYKKMGFEISIEKTISVDRRVDVLAVKGKKTAVEVEMGSFFIEDELKALDFVDELIIAVKNMPTLNHAMLKMEEQPADIQARVRICLIDDFIPELQANYNMDSNGNNPSDTTEHIPGSISGNECGNERN